MTAPWWLVPLGFGVGMFGTLIGAGGGFVLVPILLLMYPAAPPELITSISLAVVFVNATSGTVSYARMKRIDYRSGLMFAAATIPGAVLGAYSTAFVPRRVFDVVFGALLVAGAAWLIVRPTAERRRAAERPGGTRRELVEADGTRHVWHYPPWIGIVSSVFVGFASSLLGIGGGIIHVPVLSQVLGFPVHVATATSHFVLAIMALAGTLVHLFTGTLAGGLERTALLAIGVLFGAPVGAQLSSRIHGAWIMRSLAVALGLVGLRVLLGAL